MSNKTTKNNDQPNLTKEQEAYKVLQDWVKSVPDTIRQIEAEGDEKQLTEYKEQVKLVLKKLEQIKFELENEK